jgi:hypothetical protein
MEKQTRPGRPTLLIACGVFRPALEYLQLGRKYRDLCLRFLPSNLHVHPQELRRRLLEEITAVREKNTRIVCLYGNCFPDIDDFCSRHGTIKVPGVHCYEMLLGREQYLRKINETAGTYFLERELIQHFEEYCLEPLELHDAEMRKYCFEHYERLLYVRQPSDPELVAKAHRLARFLELSLEIQDADYSQLEKTLTALL